MARRALAGLLPTARRPGGRRPARRNAEGAGMNWTPYYTGTGSIPELPQRLPPPPPWRAPTGTAGVADAVQSPSPASTYRADPELVDAVNAALHLRRPLLL